MICNYSSFLAVCQGCMLNRLVNAIKGGGSNRPPLPPATAPKVGISPQNSRTFSYNPFATLL